MGDHNYYLVTITSPFIHKTIDCMPQTGPRKAVIRTLVGHTCLLNRLHAVRS